MNIYLGSDHGGWDLKEEVAVYLIEHFPDAEIFDLGCDSSESCDYPEFGTAVAKKVVKEKDALGIVICGSGVGIGIAANKVKYARCVTANTVELAILGRQHNGAQILAMGGRTKFFDPWQDIIKAFLTTKIDTAERHVKRRKQLDSL
jgi:ribose 5-phosphate isomerase B